jgi:hypothetical protein
MNNENGSPKKPTMEPHEDGYFEIRSTVNEQWEKWKETPYRRGFVPSRTPLPHRIIGGIDSDGMITVRSGKGRWNSNDSDVTSSVFDNGGHVFEGWSSDNTYRLTMIVGKRDGCGDIFVLDERSVDFGWIKIGSDIPHEGFDFTRNRAVFHHPVNRSDRTGKLEFSGSAPVDGQFSGGTVRLYGDRHAERAGSADVYIGSREHEDSAQASFQVKKVPSQKGSSPEPLFSVQSSGQARFLGAVKVGTLPEDPKDGEAGQIYYNTTMHKFRVNENGTWKTIVTE